MINQNKDHPKVLTERRSQYSDFLIHPKFQGVNSIFVLSFENEDNRKVHTGYYLLKEEIKYYNVIIDGNFFFDHPIKNNVRTCYNICKIATGQGYYTAGCLLDYNYFNDTIN